MSRIGQVEVPAFLRDLLSLIPPEYVLFLEQDSVSLVRISGRNRIETVKKRRLSDSLTAKEIIDFCAEVRKSGEYYGQHLTVFVNRRELYTYAKRMGKSVSSGVFERVKLLHQESSDLSTHMFQVQEDRVFMAQATGKELLSCLMDALEEAEINVGCVVGLSTAMIRGGLNPKGSDHSIDIFRLPSGNTVYLIQDARGNILFSNLDQSQSADGLVETAANLRGTFFQQGVEAEIRAFAPPGEANSAANQRPLAVPLKRAIRFSRRLGSLASKTRLSRLAAALRTAVNSARLLMLVLGTGFILSAITAGLSGLAAISDEGLVENYQEYYGDKLALEQTRDSLLTAERQVSASRQPTRDLAPIVSAFYQRKFNPLSLTRIYISNTSAESTFVEITGSAENENIIFKYIDAISPYAAPYGVTMSSMQPEIRNFRGSSDTTVTFKMRMIAD